MDPIIWVLALVIVVLIPILSLVMKKVRGGSEKYQQILADFQQQAQQMLEADEQIEAVCGYKPCAAVTNKRLLVSTKEGIDSVAFSEIKKLKGMNSGGNATKNPTGMLVFEIKAAKKYTLGNHSDGFNDVVNLLYRKTNL